tara:strand:+ start:1011 stop:1520 length:510 start_codon:yes stop_codon:yes gene_type:complete
MSLEESNILKLLVQDEKTWIKMCRDVSCNSRINHEDLLHDFYILIHSKIDSKKIKLNDIMDNDSLNKSFIYKMIHNLFIDTIRKDKDVLIATELSNILKADNKPYVDMEGIVDEIVNDFYWFDKKLFNLYRKKFYSIRKLSAATNIGHVVVWKTINNCIKIIKKKIDEK